MLNLFKKILVVAAMCSSAAFANDAYTVTTAIGAGGSSTNIINYLFSQMPGTSVVYDRKPGADGVVAANYYKQHVKPGDQNLFLFGMASAFVLSDVSYPGMREYSLDDYEMVISLGRAISMVVATPSSKSSSIKDMQDRVAKGERINIGTMSGIVRAWTVELADRLGGDTVVIPYKAAAQIGQDVMGGHVEFAVLNGSTAVNLHKQGLIKIIAIINGKRVADLSEIQTVSETLPRFGEGIDTTITFAFPKGTDPRVVEHHNALFKSIMQTKEAKELWQKNQIYFDAADLDRAQIKPKIERMMRNKTKLEEVMKESK